MVETIIGVVFGVLFFGSVIVIVLNELRDNYASSKSFLYAVKKSLGSICGLIFLIWIFWNPIKCFLARNNWIDVEKFCHGGGGGCDCYTCQMLYIEENNEDLCESAYDDVSDERWN